MKGLICLIAAAAAVATPPAPPSDLQRYRALAGEADTAFKAGDLALADRKLGEALDALPDTPNALLGRARVQVAEKDLAGAAETLDRYAALGLTLPAARQAVLGPLLSTPPFARAADSLAGNARPLGRAETVLLTDAAPILIEKVAFDAQGRLLVGTVHTGGVFRVEAGRPVRFSPPDLRLGVVGLQADPARGDLWVASSALPQVETPNPAGSALVRLDLKTGALKGLWKLEASGEHSWGDVALGPDGTVYLSDGLSGEIWRLKPGAAALDRVLKSRLMDSPQGMVVSDDGRRLLVADYVTGFVRVDLQTGEEQRVALPPQVTLAGTDGMAFDGRAVYAFQNGVSPDRIMAVRLDRAWLRATKVEVLLRRADLLDQPTAGVVDHGALVFVARSQWSDFPDDGSPPKPGIRPAAVARMSLSPR